jgi:ankyrin repeat protein
MVGLVEPKISKAFFKAVKDGDLAAVLGMLEIHPELVHARDQDASTPLHWAAWKGHPDLVTALLAAGADVQAHNENFHWGTTPLHAAAHGNQKHAAEALIRGGADVNALKSTGQGTPLAETRVHNATAAAKVIREAGGVE